MTIDRLNPSSRPGEAGLSVLVIEDEPAVAEVVQTALTSAGFRVRVAGTGSGGLDAASVESPDLVVIDLGLPDTDGIEVCRQLRRFYRYPIIVLSADGAEERKVAALGAGADDYVTKPFSMPELLARLRVAARHRHLAASVVDPGLLVLGDVTIDRGSRSVTVGGESVTLTKKEFDLFVLLARNPGRVLTHGTILSQVWADSRVGRTESLRVHMTYLRQKLGAGPDRPRLLTDPGVGYRLVLADTSTSAP